MTYARPFWDVEPDVELEEPEPAPARWEPDPEPATSGPYGLVRCDRCGRPRLTEHGAVAGPCEHGPR